jgi:peptide/nickel transport system substrate-binding protein
MRSPRIRRLRGVAIVMALALVVAACGTNDNNEPDAVDPDTDTEAPDDDAEDETATEDEEATTVEGGTVLFGDEQEPTILNGLLLDGNSLVTSKVFNQVFPGAYVIQPDFSMEPWLLDGEAEITEEPFSVTYTIRDDADWSDGTPITSDDFVFTFETIMSEEYADQITSTNGYDLITDYEVVDEKTVTFNYEEPFGPWQLLFPNVLPAHVLEDEDFLTVMNDEIPEISGGPFMFDSWDRGTQLRLVRNEN